MSLEKRKDAGIWFSFLRNLQGEKADLWAEDVFKVFNLINRYRPEEIVGKRINNIPVAIFIHSTKRGTALGGTRRLAYHNMANFLRDGLKLSSAMTYKAIWARLPLGGGKAVIYASEKEITENFLKKYAEFLNEINSPNCRFTTGEDIGFSQDLVDVVARHSKFIAGKSVEAGGLGDPSPYTAEGIFTATKAIIEEGSIFSGNLQGKIVSVQGAGKVALPLIKMLLEAGAHVYFSEKDGDPSAEERAKEAEILGAKRVAQELIYSMPCHIFMPCAIGGVINRITIPKLSWMCRVVIGAANNVLDCPEDGVELHNKRIYFAPDYVVNRWGLEWVAQEKEGVTDLFKAKASLSNIAADILRIFSVAREKNIATSELADMVSKTILNGGFANLEEALKIFQENPICEIKCLGN